MKLKEYWVKLTGLVPPGTPAGLVPPGTPAGLVFSALFCAFLFILPAKVFCTDDYFITGVAKYLEGEHLKAAEFFEIVLEREPDNLRAGEFLLKCYVELSMKSIIEEDYSRAGLILEKALMRFPGDLSLKKIKFSFDLIRPLPLLSEKEIKALLPGERQPLMGDFFNAGTAFYLAGKYREALAEWQKVLQLDPFHKNSIENIEKAKLKIQEQALREKLFEQLSEARNKQAETLKNYLESQELIRNLVLKSDRDRENLYKNLEDRERQLQDRLEAEGKYKERILVFLRKNRIPVLAAGLSAAVIFIIAFYRILKALSSKKALAVVSIPAKEKESMKEEMNPERQKKVRALEIIAEELLTADKADKDVAKKLLPDFLGDKDFLVQLQALSIYYDFEPKKAIDEFRKILAGLAEQEYTETKTNRLLLEKALDNEFDFSFNEKFILQAGPLLENFFGREKNWVVK